MDDAISLMPARPPVSVIVPFRGSVSEAAALVRALCSLELRDGDELIVADNSDDQAVALDGTGHVTVVAAAAMRSSYYARNVGAEAAANPWLLFIDSDCRPSPNLLDAYFAEPIPEDWGAIAGEIQGAADQVGLIPRYAATRGHLRQADIQEHPYRPMAVTANLLVRQEAWAELGGFHEGIRSAGDSDFSWRLQDAGWRLGYRSGAMVEHEFWNTLPALARRFARYGAGGAWAKRRHPGYPQPRVARQLARCLAGMPVLVLRGQFERAVFKAVDAVVVLAGAAGWLMSNVSPRRPAASVETIAHGDGVLILVDAFPELTQTFVIAEMRALQRAGHRLRVEAGARAQRPSWGAARALDVRYLEDDGVARKAVDLLWLVTRHPSGCLRDLSDQRAWRREEGVWPLRSLAPVIRRHSSSGESHIHAYFAAGAALNALRIARLTGTPYSVTAYAWEIFRAPRNLNAKLADATFVATVSQNGVSHLRDLLSGHSPPRVELVGMGVDGERFRRGSAPPDARRVLAVGRLVEKKGFSVLIDAVARLRDSDAPVHLVIAGDGPLRRHLTEQVRQLRLEDSVDLIGARDHHEIRELMEAADLFAMPCVIAADGDQDSLPAVVSEALAMELPVVATDVAGLPEVIAPEWGRVVPSGDAAALAAAIAEVLALPTDLRGEMGRSGREWILEHRDPDREADRLASLIASAGSQSTRTP